MPDLNLLLALDVLIEEGSVVGAARRMNLSAPAMSRTLGRIREAVGDPVLVRSGRGLAPTPRALQLREQVREVIEQAHLVFNAGREVDMLTLERTFSIRANDVFVGTYGGRMRELFQAQAPRAVLRFVPEGDGDDDAMQQGRIDLHISTAGKHGADTKVQNLFSTSFFGAAREDHPLFADEITVQRFVAYDHIAVSRRGRPHGPIDDYLTTQGLQRRVAQIMPTFHSAIFAAADSDLILPQMPSVMLGRLERLGVPLRLFELPIPVSTAVVVQAWHPRLDSDLAHRWLRRSIKALCDAQSGLA
ncbi:DNA-binding transcriptional LysR family regulator [Stenotrophomonas sp. 2619]|uniref:LysR family transcriptional regulator n=1 Tax=Stenotrophomonas sp. 2619 TaxID=3156316 RepID=UPI00339A6008